MSEKVRTQPQQRRLLPVLGFSRGSPQRSLRVPVPEDCEGLSGRELVVINDWHRWDDWHSVGAASLPQPWEGQACFFQEEDGHLGVCILKKELRNKIEKAEETFRCNAIEMSSLLEQGQQDWRVNVEFYNAAGNRVGKLRYGSGLRDHVEREQAEKEIARYRPYLIRAT